LIHLRHVYAFVLLTLTALSSALASAHDGHASSNVAFIPAGATADAPAGFVAMCARDFRLCGREAPADMRTKAGEAWQTGSVGQSQPPAIASSDASAAPDMAVPESKAQDKLLEKVNWAVNTTVIQRSDQEIFGVDEYWARPGNARGASGDCEDLALEKRMRLIAAGFPASRLFFAVVYRRNFGLHTVLIARTDGGDRVLDSLTGEIVAWRDAPYSWLRLQTPGQPYHWTRVGNL
jgi:predicted transglutaminase-like cysteine proteinase